jgi:colanic acid/amylovoran biosynthesis glycosyltransferase
MAQLHVIAYITSQYARAGDTFIRGEVQELRRRGHTVHTFSIRDNPGEEISEDIARERKQTEYILTVGVLRLLAAFLTVLATRPASLLASIRLAMKVRPPGIRAWIRHAAYIVEATYLARRLRLLGVEHLHNHIGENSATVAMLASRIANVPFSQTIHGPGIFFHPREWSLGEKIQRSAFTACISSYCRSQCMMFSSPDAWDRLHIVRCVVAPRFRDIDPSPLREGAPFIFVGRLALEKGILVLIDALAELRRQSDECRLEIIGDGDLKWLIERRIAERDLNNHVCLRGWRSGDEIVDALGRSRVFVLPSFAEGLPVVIMEALAMGRPVISSSLSGIPELVRPGENGWLVPPGDVSALADAMQQALNAPLQSLETMGRAGRRAVLERHNALREGAKLEQLIRESIADSGQRIHHSKVLINSPASTNASPSARVP